MHQVSTEFLVVVVSLLATAGFAFLFIHRKVVRKLEIRRMSITGQLPGESDEEDGR
jgi:hypothetical protein